MGTVLSNESLFGEWDKDKEQIITAAMGVGAFLLTWIVLLFTRRLIWKRLRAFAEKTPRTWDEDLLRALSFPLHALIFFLAVGVGLYAFPNKVQALPSVVNATKIIFILLAAWIVDRVSGVAIKNAALPGTVSEEARSLLVTGVRVLFFSVVLLVILDTLGISITPILASLGVGSIAVALALQDTLGNLFSGFYVLIDRPVRVGDYVLLSEGVEGTVRKIGWRSTRLELLTNNMVVVPNAKLSSAILTNFNLPLAECVLKVECGVAYESDLEHVEKVVLEVARELQRKSTFAVAEHEPVVRFLSFADSSITFNARLKAKSYPDTGPLRHEYIKMLHARFKKEGIDIPYPQRVIRTLAAAPIDE